MALLDIVTFEGVPMSYEMARGDIGVLVDVQGGQKNEFNLPSTGGSCTYPDETDVRDGVVFGGVYTGNLELPVEADVRDGTPYGANGVEFEGTLVVGGGSSEHSHTFLL